MASGIIYPVVDLRVISERGYGDLNDYTEPGVYYLTRDNTNVPSYGRWTFLIVLNYPGRNLVLQIVPSSDMAHGVYIRNKSGDTWTSWYQLAATAVS